MSVAREGAGREWWNLSRSDLRMTFNQS